MTEDAIVEKLRAALSDEVDSECKVVYVLAESRKLLESYPPEAPQFALKLYCHWALHVNLHNPRHTLPFLERVDEYVASVLARTSDIVKEHGMLREFVFLDTFRQQFKRFLQTYDLPTNVCDEDSRWHEFLKHYAGIIEDGSLSCQAKSDSLKRLSQVVFRKGRAATSGNHIPFDLSWTIVLLDGSLMTVDVKAVALPDGNRMISHVTRLNGPDVRIQSGGAVSRPPPTVVKDTWSKKMGHGTMTFTTTAMGEPVAAFNHEAKFEQPDRTQTRNGQSTDPLTREEVESRFADFVSELLDSQKG